MRNTLFAAALALAAITGCTKSDSTSAPAPADKAAPTAVAETAKKAPVATASVDEVDTAVAAGAQAVDCNGDETRKKLGVVPGAILISDQETYALSELPSDKSKALVFYCANQQCGASHHAAEKALTAGYTNVKVMPDGIAGWVKAGKKTQTL